MPSDEHILELIAAASPSGIEMLYDKYGARAYALALRVLGDGHAAEDVVQEAFLAVWRRAATYRPERGSLRSWLFSIVHHRAVDRLRGRSGRDRGDLPLDTVAAGAAAQADTWDAVLAELERTEVRRALDALPVEQRQPIELAYFGGHTQSEISRLLRIPLGTVKGRTRLGMRKLGIALAGAGNRGGER